jgi:hypothetical protein
VAHLPQFEIAGLTLVLWCSMTAAQPQPEVFCGLGPAPGSKAFEQYTARQNLQRASLGFVLVCEQDLDRLDFSRFSKPIAESRKRLVFTPLDLSRTPFSSMAAVGELAEHRSDEGAFALRRYFRTKDGGTASFFEWEIDRAGGSVKHFGEFRTVQVRDRVARLVRAQTPSGQSYTALSWESAGAYLEVSLRSPNFRDRDNTLYVTELAETVESAHRARPR